MIKAYLFSQNLVLSSLAKLSEINDDEHIFITTHKLFDTEEAFIKGIFSHATFVSFAELLNDSELEECDTIAYSKNQKNVSSYYEKIKSIKNKKIIDKVKEKYNVTVGFVLADDLGISKKEWIEFGFEECHLDYYYKKQENFNFRSFCASNALIKTVYSFVVYVLLRKKNTNYTEDVYVSHYGEKKLVFIGKLSRIGYRMNIQWKKSDYEYSLLSHRKFQPQNDCIYLTTLHESGKSMIPDNKKYDVRYIQDGYLPGNYSSKYLCFKPQNVKYYSWDKLGEECFIRHNLPVSIMPFRKKIYLPTIDKKPVKTVLVATSGPGDWTAQKNRSDEDLMFMCFVQIAKDYPDITIIYRCHPTWVHPKHNGVNSIKRLAEYIETNNIKNLKISTNIPSNDINQFRLSFSRSSIEDDIAQSDLVFGEHSISMIDAAMQGVPFSSINLTQRRNLFEGITKLGFPHCISIDDVKRIINERNTDSFVNRFNDAIIQYNKMTDEED